MAINGQAVPPNPPLSFMTKLSQAVYLLKPDTASSTRFDPSAPALIFLCGWMAARDIHLAKYVRNYQALYPTASILLLKSRSMDMAFPFIARSDAEPAIAPLRGILRGSPATPDKAQLLVHLFSGAGSGMLSAVYDMYAASGVDEKDRILPLHITIFDSSPALKFDHGKITDANIVEVPEGPQRIVMKPIMQFVLAFWWISFSMLGFTDYIAGHAIAHNDARKVREVRRAYVYSDRDPFIPSEGVEKHAELARRAGFNARTELFVGSPHCAHARAEPERYWRIVRETWEGKPLDPLT